MAILDRFRLDGRVAIVTGASSGLGAEAARQMASAGARLAIGARRPEKLTRLRDEIQSREAKKWQSRSM